MRKSLAVIFRAACKLVLTALLAITWLAIPAGAQLTTGVIAGTVTDPSGAAVPSAEVTVKNVETGIARSTATGPTGRYEMPNLQAGQYEVSATLAGFQMSVRTGIALTIGRTAVVDHTLQVGEVTQTVTVTGEVSLVETTTATVSQLVDERKVADLPLRDRDLTQLVFLQPGVIKSTSGRGDFSGMGDKITVAGARGTQNLFLLDGVNNADLSNNPQGASGSYTGAETVKEFQIITNNYSAEYQSAAGAIISAVTKSGTNALHGSAFGTLRNDNLDANSWANNRRVPSSPKREFKRSQFGGSVGGPIRPDKTFFFGSYEGFRERNTDTDEVITWTDATRAGLLSAQDGGGSVNVDPTVRRYMDLWPRPNTPYRFLNNMAMAIKPVPCLADKSRLCDDNGDGTVTLIAPGSNQIPVNEEFVGSKFDHSFGNERWGFLSGTYNWVKSERLPSDALKALGQGTSPGNNAAISTKHTLGVSHTTTFSPTIVNEFKFGYSWSEISSDIPKPRYDSSAKVDLKDLVFLNSRELVGEIGAPRVTGIGFRTDTSTYGQTSYQYKEGLSIAHGNHSFRMGTEFRLLRYLQGSCSRGCNGVFIWNDLRTFLLNQPRQLDTYIPGSDNPTRHLNQMVAGFYFQDNWQLLPSLNVNLGMRYEFGTVPDEQNDLESALVHIDDPYVTVTQKVKDDPRFSRFPSMPGTVDSLFTNPTLKSFSPRVGLAWSPGNKRFSLRTGFGIFYEVPNLYNIRNPLQEIPPFAVVGSVLATNAAQSGVTLRMQPGVANDPAVVSLLRGSPVIRGFEYDMKNTTIYRWSFTLQQEVTRGFVVSAGYTGSRGTHLWHQKQANTNRWLGFPNPPADGNFVYPLLGTAQYQGFVNPNFGEMRIIAPDVDSYFHGLAIGAEKRLSHGFQVQAAFNVSKNLDTGSGITSSGDAFSQGQWSIHYRGAKNMFKGPAQFDIRRVLTTNFIYDVPDFGTQGLLRSLVGGWQFSGIMTLRDGAWISLLNSSTVQLNAIGNTANLRANLVSGGNINPVLDSRDAFNYYDKGMFLPSSCTGVTSRGIVVGQPVCRAGDPEYQPGRFGNLGRNTLNGPGSATLDISIKKAVNITEKQKVEFTSEFFNFLNRTNLSDLGMNLAPFDTNDRPSAAFATAGQITNSNPPRLIQMQLKYTF